MKINNQTSSAAQAVSAENRESLMSLLRDSLRVKAEQMLEEEVNARCGESHRPEAGAQYRRAGSERGSTKTGQTLMSVICRRSSAASGRWPFRSSLTYRLTPSGSPIVSGGANAAR